MTVSRDAIDAYVKERNEALSKLDMDWARRQQPTGTRMTDDVLLTGMHMARYEAVGVAPALRHESRIWLTERSLRRLGALPWPDSEELPK